MGTPVEGSESENQVPDGQVQGEITSDNTPGPNPNWEPVLQLLPEQFHSAITPHFTQWDQAAQSRIESLNAQYEPFKPFIEHGISQEDLNTGLRLMQVLENDPKTIYDALAQQFNIQQQAAPETVPTGEETSEYTLPPDYDKLKQGVELMAQRMLDAENQAKQARESAQLEADLKEVEKKHGTFNPELLLPFIGNAVGNNPKLSVMQAADNYFELQNQMLQQRQAAQPYAPNLLGNVSGGGVGLPSQAIDPRQLDDKGTKDLVIQMLKQAAQQP